LIARAPGQPEETIVRLVDQGVTRLTLVQNADGIANEAAPTLTELATGIDLTCQMVTTYEVRADASDTTNERAVCDTANVVTPTVQNYIGTFQLFRQWDNVAMQWTTEDVLQYLSYGSLFWFVRRMGFARDVAYASNQQVETYLFMADTPQITGGTGDGYLKATVPLLQQGRFDVKAIVAA
jgi:hypothetical protein